MECGVSKTIIYFAPPIYLIQMNNIPTVCYTTYPTSALSACHVNTTPIFLVAEVYYIICMLIILVVIGFHSGHYSVAKF